MSRSSESYLLAYRRDRPNEAAIEKAVKLTEREPELHRRLESQVRFDEQIARAIHAIAPPASLRPKVHGENGKPGVKGKPFALSLLITIICSASVVVGLLIYFELDRRQKFAGSEAVARIVGTAKHMSGVELSEVDNQAGQLADWFFMRGFEAYDLPPELAEARAIGSRVLKQDGHLIAQLAVAAASTGGSSAGAEESAALVFLVRADDFGINLPAGEDWRYVKLEDWAAAVRSNRGICTIVALRGSKGDLGSFLKSLEKKP